MSKRNREIVPRNNFYDGQRVDESDLDTEQIYHLSSLSSIVLDFHGSGVVRETPFENRILIDTRKPGFYVDNGGENPSKNLIESGTFDGQGIKVDQQPSDTVRGNRLEIEIGDSQVMGRNKVKVVILGHTFDGASSGGLLTAEVLEFSKNGKLLTDFYYLEVISLILNNFSGGTGKTEVVAAKDSLDLAGDSGWLTIREADPLSVFPATDFVKQIESPNYDLQHFITSDTANSIEDEIVIALGPENNISDLYIEFSAKEQLRFEAGGSTTVSYGQKFLSTVTNIQRVDLLLSVEIDDDQPPGQEYDFSGDLVLSIHEVASDIACSTDSIPDDLINYDPEVTPIVEISFSQQDLEALGYKLDGTPQRVAFNFAGTLIANPNIDPSVSPGKFYAFMISRRGDNQTGTVLIEKGYDEVSRKEELNVQLSIFEQFGKRTTQFFEFDPITKRYVDDITSALWHVVYADAIEIVDGAAYSDDGVGILVPKTTKTVGGSEISYFQKDLSMVAIGEGDFNYVTLSHLQKFTTPDNHPRTHQFVFTRIEDAGSAVVVNSAGLGELREDTDPVILARVTDRNVRDAQAIEGDFNKPGLIGTNTIIIPEPTSEMLVSNLINRVISPDVNCDCNARYRVVASRCLELKAGDLNEDGEITSEDISLLLELTGNTINSAATEKKILGGEIDIIDFIQADLNSDQSIDGDDINLIEDAVDGYVNFTTPTTLKFLILTVENILESGDYPTYFVDIASSGTATASTAQVVFTTVTTNQALTIRPGDKLTIEASFNDSGNYLVSTKSIANDGITVTVTVTETDGSEVSFIGSAGFDITLQSGTAANMLADNQNLVNVPFEATEYSISFVDAPFEPMFLDVCDLRRLVGISFIEEKQPPACIPVAEGCEEIQDCSPQLVNQTFIPNDLFVRGDILESPGVPYHGDFEYSNIKIPLPPGTIDGCQVDLYNTFIKSYSNTSKTAAGYPAMRYSDGTLVGCEDSGLNTDITKGRIKFGQALASLYVDALVDGYAADGYADASDQQSATESIQEEFIDASFGAFDTWTDDPGNSPLIVSITHLPGPNTPAIYSLTTSADTTDKFGRLNTPVANQNFAGDFIIDIIASRVIWSSGLTGGTVSSFARLVIDNITTESTIDFGWRQTGSGTAKIFYSGVTEDNSSVVLGTFDFSIDVPDEVGDDVIFRLRRTDDVVKAYYIVPGSLIDSEVPLGEFIRVGGNPDIQPGSGTATLSYEMRESGPSPTALIFTTEVSSVIMRTEYTSDNDVTELSISRDGITGEIHRATVTFPFVITRRTNLVSATLVLTPTANSTALDSFNVIPLDIMNADNLGSVYNIPETQDISFITTFSPGTVVTGSAINIDVTPAFVHFLSESGHLPGLIKGLLIEPDISANSGFTVGSAATLIIEYEDITTGVIFKVGVDLDLSTGILTLNTKNILYDTLNEANRTVLNFGVLLKKYGFKNQDVEIGIADLSRIGIGICFDESESALEDDECFFIVGADGGTGGSAVGTLVQGPFPCSISLP